MPDQLTSFRYQIEISGLRDAFFTECSGLEMKVDVEEYKEGGLNDYTHKLPGRRSYSNITLKRGVIDSIELYQWVDRVVTKKAKKEEKKNISLILYAEDRKESMRWNLINAFPVKWSGGSMNTDQSQVYVETLELAYQEFTLTKR
jgi:phage tail-like protein